MRHVLFALLLFAGLQQAVAQNSTLHLLDSLPGNFMYQLDVDSFAQMEHSDGTGSISYFRDSMEIGCFNGLKVKLEFSLLVGHPFLYEGNEAINLHMAGQDASNFQLPLYAVKRESAERDSLLLAALDYYCFYSQSNYVFLSNDYLLFTNTYALGATGLVLHLKKLGFWSLIENRIIAHLNAGASLAPKVQAVTPTNNPFHKKELIAGTYVSSQQVNSAEQSSANENKRPHTLLRLDKNGGGRSIANYHQIKANWMRDRCDWWMDNHYIYVRTEGSNMKIYTMTNENELLQLNGKYGFVRTTKGE